VTNFAKVRNFACHRVTGVVYDDTQQWLLGSWMKFSQTAVVVVKDSVQ